MAAMLAFGLLLTYQHVIAEDDALAMLRQALKKHEGIAGVKIVADVEGVRQGGRITFEKLGNRMRFDGILATEETSEKRQVWLDEFNKSGKPIEWASYDGKRLINYYPLGMRLIVRSMTTPMFPRCVFQIDPAYWGKLDMGFEYKGFALKEVETKKNVHRFHERFGERSTAFTELFIEADENQGWNITHVESIGGIQGREIVDVSWAEKEGRCFFLLVQFGKHAAQHQCRARGTREAVCWLLV